MTNRLLIRRTAAILTAMLLMHLGAMAVDPAGMHGSAHAAPSHAGHMSHSPHDVEAKPVATVDLVTSIDALVCIGTEGVTTQSRVCPDSVVVDAVLPSLDVWRPLAASGPQPDWIPPVTGAQELRIFLQVFLN